jgi:AcrR family transcriptional regulator
VEELARAAGISKGAFYGFFDSKESLFLALIDEYELQAHADIDAAVQADPHKGIEVLLEMALYALERMPLLGVALSDEGLRVLRTRTEAEQRVYLHRDERLISRVLALLDDAGVRPAATPSVLLALLRSLVMLGAHREDVGELLADELAAWLVPTLRQALLGAGGDGAK